ncbi:hypothetical protein WMF37_01630 [Sorangium sp. So ce291]|uniref:hypothetical protein n=1 Tax=Sorangium sp. So ce291 TaxID=3133294 RepID=UPI003F63CE93
MVHRLVSSLGSLLLVALGLSAGASHAAAALEVPDEALLPEAPPIVLSGDAGQDDDEDPDPSDPQCGACGTYVLKDQRLYALIQNQGAPAYLRLDLYAQDGALVGTYTIKPTSVQAGGRVIYAVPGGPVQRVAEWAVMRWNDQSGALQEAWVDIQGTWLGWTYVGIQ